ncbi:unnamed protein product [Arctogadus glacialis]
MGTRYRDPDEDPVCRMLCYVSFPACRQHRTARHPFFSRSCTLRSDRRVSFFASVPQGSWGILSHRILAPQHV